ncbi:Cytochrome oxidase biogenesis protein Surf1, facilitates heme A insertion [Thioalkalivibrio nitratireducens DSM 14787]|uniref:SURF1-like protein n=1 Tax=Thioalkalivibrio nitratireducens (strain DSM 14787 / UNIQEM 213 / ALEN2) TaxID=1255043 RepID=L0E034_THIND|nr:SURF1 family protein [Thioalkalivibrio nitratireducens]AGA34658.1 Cytochrome oxidase biogenesis protein Surf1, facilitates heme A insertion [Thioalkalivibrio nitratireducens DSM 14787]
MAPTVGVNQRGAARARFLRWVPWVAGVALLALFLALGHWQLQRADEKRALLAAFEAAAGERYQPLDLSADPLETLRFQAVVVSGHYLREQQFLLDNQVREGRIGYRVITPLVHSGSGRAVLIERGWIPRSPERGMLPDVSEGLSADPVSIRGHVYVPFGEGYRLGAMDDAATWPRVIQYLDFEAMGERLQRDVVPLTVRLDPDQPSGYLRDWRPVLPMGPERHLAYAVQWFGLALALVIIALVLTRRRRFHEYGR